MGGCEGGRTGKSVDDRHWNDVTRQCIEGGKVEVGNRHTRMILVRSDAKAAGSWIVRIGAWM